MKRDVEKLWQWRARSKPLRHQSRKRQRENAERSRILSTITRYNCEARHAPVECYGALTTHEIKPAGRNGSRVNPGNLATVCARHNEWLSNAGQAWGYENGLLKHSWDNEDVVE